MEYQQQVVQLTYKGAQLTSRTLLALLKAVLKNWDNNTIVHGEQSLKKLNLQNRQLESVKLDDADIKGFKKELKRHGVDFSVMQDKQTGEYKIFFKAQDIDRVHSGLERCVQEFDKKSLRNEQKDRKPMKERFEAAQQQADARNAARQQDTRTQQKERTQNI